jgi:hypothetical protein
MLCTSSAAALNLSQLAVASKMQDRVFKPTKPSREQLDVAIRLAVISLPFASRLEEERRSWRREVHRDLREC